MTLREYLESIQELVNENPEILDYKVIYSSDSEGNSFHELIYGLSIGNYNQGEFISTDYIAEMIDFREIESDDELTKINAICIN